MKFINKRYASIFLLLFCSLFIVFYLFDNRHLINEVSNNPLDWLLFVLSGLFVYLFRGLVFQYQVRMHNGILGLRNAISDVSYTTILNSFLPSSSGSFFLISRFSKMTNQDFKHSISAQSIGILLILWWASVYTILSVDTFLTDESFRNILIPLKYFCALVPFSLILTKVFNFNIVIPILKLNITNMIRPIFSKFGFFYIAATFFESVSTAYTLFYGIKLFSVNLDLPSTMLLSGIRNLSLFFSITPGSFGSSEAILFFLSGPIGVTGVTIVAASILLRIMTLITGIIGVTQFKLGKGV